MVFTKKPQQLMSWFIGASAVIGCLIVTSCAATALPVPASKGTEQKYMINGTYTFGDLKVQKVAKQVKQSELPHFSTIATAMFAEKVTELICSAPSTTPTKTAGPSALGPSTTPSATAAASSERNQRHDNRSSMGTPGPVRNIEDAMEHARSFKSGAAAAKAAAANMRVLDFMKWCNSDSGLFKIFDKEQLRKSCNIHGGITEETARLYFIDLGCTFQSRQTGIIPDLYFALITIFNSDSATAVHTHFLNFHLYIF